MSRKNPLITYLIMKITKTWLLLPVIAAAVAYSSSCNKTTTITKTVTDTLTVKDTVTDTLTGPHYSDSLKRSLWGYYKFNGNFADSSGNSHNMTPYNNIAFSNDAFGNPNSALNFTGLNASNTVTYAVIDSGVNFPNGPFSVSFMVMTRALTGRIFEKADFNTGLGASITYGYDNVNGVGTDSVSFSTSATTDVCSVPSVASNTYQATQNQIPSIYAWNYITLNFDGANLTVYVNGQLQASKAGGPNTLCSDAPFYVGMWWLQDIRPFNGKMDELRIYTRALSIGEIQYLAKAALKVQ